jgi:hypothetical protein
VDGRNQPDFRSTPYLTWALRSQRHLFRMRSG